MGETVTKRNIINLVATPRVSAISEFKLFGHRTTLVIFNPGDVRAGVTSLLVVCLFDTCPLCKRLYFFSYSATVYVSRSRYSQYYRYVNHDKSKFFQMAANIYEMVNWREKFYNMKTTIFNTRLARHLYSSWVRVSTVFSQRH